MGSPDAPSRWRLLARAPFDWLGIVGWGAQARRPDAWVLVQAVVIEQGRVLLALRRELRGFELPGGRAEAGEDEPDALARELREETGLEVEVGALVGTYRRRGFAAHRARVYRCRVRGGTLRPSPDMPEVGWFALDALPDTLFPWFRGPLLDALAERSGPTERDERLGLAAIAAGMRIDLRARWSPR